MVSGGKDSVYAFYLMLQQGFEIGRWITFVPQIKESYMLHSVNLNFVSLQAKLSKVKHTEIFVSGKKEEEVDEMLHYLKALKEREKFSAVICGAVMSEYQKERIDMICRELGIPCYAPLWRKNGENLLREMVEQGFEFIVTYGGEEFEKWIGKKVSEESIEEFLDFLKSIRADVCGEGGEYETFVVKTPFWNRELKLRGKKVREGNSVKFEIESLKVEKT